MYMVHVCTHAFGGACGAHVCFGGACVLTYVFGGACGAHVCMYVFWYIYAPVIGVLWCTYGGACHTHVSMWCMYVYIVHICMCHFSVLCA